MKKYKAFSEGFTTEEFTDYEKAVEAYEKIKEQEISEQVDEDSYVELIVSEDDFEDSKTIKRAVIIVDEERMAISTPKEDGYEWDYWAKWKETI